MDLTNGFITEDNVGLVDAELERQEQNLDSASLCALLNLELILLDVERLWDVGVGGGLRLGSSLLALLPWLSTRTFASFAAIFAFLSSLSAFDDAISLVLDRNIEEHFLHEGIVN